MINIWKKFQFFRKTNLPNYRIHESVEFAKSAIIGEGTSVWNFSQVMSGVRIGTGCIVGRHVFLDSNVKIGNNCKIQNNATLYSPTLLGDGVFIGPGVIFTNDNIPRAVNPNGTLKSNSDWKIEGVSVEDGASIGAGAVCVAPVKIGKWAMVAAGAVVTKDVASFALVAGIPARQIGWVCKSGHRLVVSTDNLSRLICPITREIYTLRSGRLYEGT